MYCKYCGRQVDEQTNFCPRCGGRLKGAVAPAQTAAPVQPIVPVQKKPVNGLGIAAFVLGIVSLFLGFYLFFVPIAGVVLGAIGVAYRNKYRLNGLAIAGLAISCAAFVLWLIIWIYALFYAMAGLFFLFCFPFLLA